MRTPYFFRSLPFLALFAGLTLAPAADKSLLRPHFEPGKVYTIENTMDMTTTVPGLGDKGEQKTSVKQTMTITVKAEPGTDKRLATVKFAGIQANMSVMGQSMTYDSNDPAKSQPMLQQAFGAIVGKEFTLVYDKDDKVAELRGAENLVPTPVGAAKGPNGQQMADAFRKGQEMGLPKEGVAVGDTWTFDDSIQMPPAGTIQIKGNGKYDSDVEFEGRKHAKVLIEGTFSTPPSPAGAVPFKFGDGSTMKGETLFDTERHVATQSTVNTELKMNINGQEIPMSQKVVNRIVSVTDAK